MTSMTEVIDVDVDPATAFAVFTDEFDRWWGRGPIDSYDSWRLVERRIRDKTVSSTLFKEIGPRFAARPGGYTRIIRLGHREGDGAETARIELLAE